MRLRPWLAVSAMLQFAVVAIVQAEDLKSLTNEELVARLVSPNKPPPRLSGSPRDRFRPGEDYDYPAQEKICLAAEELLKRGKDALPELFKHSDDQRYSVTRQSGTGATHNLTVSDHCYLVRSLTLNAMHHRGGPNLGPFHWRKEYEKLSLWEIQAEVLKEKLRKSDDEQAATSLKREREKLEKSRQAIVNEYPWIGMAIRKDSVN